MEDRDGRPDDAGVSVEGVCSPPRGPSEDAPQPPQPPRGDTAARDRAEAAIRAIRSQLGNSLEALPMAILTIGRDERVLSWNPAAERLFGWKAEEVIGGPNPIVPAESREEFRESIGKALRGAMHDGVELRRLRKDGSLIDVRLWAVPFQGEDGDVAGSIGLFADITARKETEAALRARTRQLEALRSVSEEIARELDLTVLLELITRRAVELMEGDSGTILLWDDTARVLIPKAWYGLGDWRGAQRLSPGEGVAGAAVERRKGLIVNEYATSPYAYAAGLAHVDLVAVIGEPLLYGNRLVGAITVDRHRDSAPFTEKEGAILTLFATQAAIAIENARLHERVTMRLKSQQALTRLSRIISASLGVDAVLHEIAHSAQALMGASLVSFWMVDEVTRTLEPRAYSDTAVIDYPHKSHRFGEGGVGWVAEHRRPLYVPDRCADPRFVAQAWARAKGLVSFLGIPVILGEALLAILVLNGRHPFRLDPDEQSLLDSFVAQAAIALHNAQLYDAAQREIAERKQAEAALQESERQLALAIAGSGVGIWDWRVQTGETVFNARWAEIVGYSLEELAPISIQTWIDLAHPEDLAKSNVLLQQHFAGAIPVYECEARMRHKDGHWVWVLDRGTVTEWDPEGRPLRMTGTHLDITARKQLEEERLIRSKLESTGLLAGGIAHDFNNLLTVILGNLDLIEASEKAEQVTLLADAKQAVQDAHALTQQFLTFARGGIPVRQGLALADVCRGAVSLALRGASVECDFALPPDLWPIQGNPGQLGQALRNLALNAREAMPSGGRLTLTARNLVGPPPSVQVTIADEGPGIPPDVLPRIFDPYFSTKERGDQRGMGLGLTAARAIVEKHEGTLTVDTAVGRGTTVQITLPAAAPAAMAPAAVPSVQPGRGRLLVMDDEPAVRTTAGALLRQLGYTVALAEHGERAISLYEEAQRSGRPFDAVILDLTVRGRMGGLETLRALQRQSPTVKAIASSGYAVDPILLDPLCHGFQNALVKPYRLAELSEVVAKTLER